MSKFRDVIRVYQKLNWNLYLKLPLQAENLGSTATFYNIRAYLSFFFAKEQNFNDQKQSLVSSHHSQLRLVTFPQYQMREVEE